MRELSWDDEFSARFKKLDDRDVEVWDEIISNEVRNLKAGEVRDAVRALGEEKRNGKHKYAPSVENLISAIIKNRWQQRIARDSMGPQNDVCVFCGGIGWIAFGGTHHEHETFKGEFILSIGAHHYIADNWPYEEFAVPCLCSRGQSALKSYPEAAHERINSLTRMVVDWKKKITADSPFEDRRFAVDEEQVV